MQPQIKIPIVLEFPIYLKFNWLEETAGIFEKKSRFKFWDFLDWSLLAQEVLYWKPSYFTCQSDTLPDFLPVFMFLTDFHTGLWGSRRRKGSWCGESFSTSQAAGLSKNAVGVRAGAAKGGSQTLTILENVIENFILITVPEFLIFLWSVVTNIKDDRHRTLGKVTSTCTWESLQHKHRKPGPLGSSGEGRGHALPRLTNGDWISAGFPAHLSQVVKRPGLWVR